MNRLPHWLLTLSLAASCTVQAASTAGNNWDSYGGDAGGTRYSSLRQITRANVARLGEVWRYETPDPGAIETTPLIVDGTMYVVSARQKVTALDAATGKVKWTFDSGIGVGSATRGLAWWSDRNESRLFSSVASYIYAINPVDGTAIASFGDNGRIDLRANLRGDAESNSFTATSPGVVYKDMLILGGRVAESAPASPGDERAFDVRTGKLRWTFHTIPRAGEPGAETWPAGAGETQGGANAWAGSIVDTDRGIVFIATGSPADDFYGANRPGDNLYGDCVIALDANTGRKLWHFQAVHHDLWDSDFASPPVLLTVNYQGRRIDAVAASNKQGYIYIFDRVTGKPIFPIVEVKVPASTVPGEVASPTQPIPTLPAPLVKKTMSRDAVTNRTPELRAWAQNEYDGFLGAMQPYTPLSVDKTTVVAPGWQGGVQWGGITADPGKGILYINSTNIMSLGTLADAAAYSQSGQGERTYRAQCMGCHGADRKGTPPTFPALVDVDKRLAPEQLADIIRSGRGRMPGFPLLSATTVTNVMSFLSVGKDAVASRAQPNNRVDAKYVLTGFFSFDDPEGFPASPTPWGTLNAIDMNTGKYLWTVPFGQYPELAKRGLAGTGAENHGGSIVTSTGVLLIGGSSHDLKFRAFDSATGKILWEQKLPGDGVATPATYAVHGKQYVVLGVSPKRADNVVTADDAPAGGFVSKATYVVYALP